MWSVAQVGGKGVKVELAAIKGVKWPSWLDVWSMAQVRKSQSGRD